LAKPALRLPANVVTSPVDVTLRMQKFLLSTTKRLPLLSKARPAGELKAAADPTPSA
jgi:hypothetical protein